ncbi:MAG: hypothetical protein R2705_21355 [Ilumatobacteraceae bacterium]
MLEPGSELGVAGLDQREGNADSRLARGINVGDLTVFHEDGAYVVVRGDGLMMSRLGTAPATQQIIVPFAGERQGAGLYGNLNGDPSDDGRLLSGQVVDTPDPTAVHGAFLDAWSVSANNSLFRNALSAAQSTPRRPGSTTTYSRPSRRSTDRRRAMSRCRSRLGAGFEECAFDVAVTGGVSYVADSVDAEGAAIASTDHGAGVRTQRQQVDGDRQHREASQRRRSRHRQRPACGRFGGTAVFRGVDPPADGGAIDAHVLRPVGWRARCPRVSGRVEDLNDSVEAFLNSVLTKPLQVSGLEERCRCNETVALPHRRGGAVHRPRRVHLLVDVRRPWRNGRRS